jgi:CheY-like chemotaxis protein
MSAVVDPTLTVLLAEDDEGHATLVRRNLLRAGLPSTPVPLRDGQEVLDYLYRRGGWTNRPTHDSLVLILDLNMPRLGGLEVLGQLKRNPLLARIPVFVLTTTDSPVELDRCYALGAATCMVKPVDYAAFSDMVRHLAEFLMAARMPSEVPASGDRG